MAKALLVLGHSGKALSASTGTFWLGIGDGTIDDNMSSEAEAQVVYRTAGVLSNLYVKASVSTTSATTTIRTRKNGANGTQVVTLTAGSVGDFEDTTHTDTIASGDKMNYIVSMSGSGDLTLTVVASVFAATSNTCKRYVNSGNANYVTASTTYFAQVAGIENGVNTTEVKSKFESKTAGTLQNLQVYVSTNGRSTTSTFKSRKNAADGAMSCAVGGGSTGLFEDTSNTDSIAIGDYFNYAVVNSTGVGNLVITILSCEFLTTNSKFHSIWGTGGSGNHTIAAAATVYMPPAGFNTGSGNITTEADAKTKVNLVATASNLWVYVTANALATTGSTVASRKNAAAGNQSISIGTLATGEFEDTTHTDSLIATDYFDVQFVAGTGVGNITITQIGNLFTVVTSVNYTFATDVGSLALTGQTSILRYGRTLVLNSGSYALNPLFPTTSIAAFWKMDEGSGTTTADASGNSNTATRSGSVLPAWVTGKLINGLYFDGNSSRLQVEDSNSLDLTTGMTLSVWIKNDDLTQTSRYLLSKLNTVGNDNAYAILFGYTNTNSVQFYRQGNLGYGYPNTNSKIDIPADANWHHVVYTYNGSQWKGYLNGVLQHTVSLVSSIVASTGRLHLGSFDSSAGFKFKGTMDEVGIWSVALTDAQVAIIYNGGNATTYGSTTNGRLIFIYGRGILAAVGSFVLSGQAAILTSVRRLQLALGTYAITGQNVIMSAQRMLVAALGSFALSGQNLLFSVARFITAAVGSFTLTGQAATFLKAMKLRAVVGAYVLTGQVVSILFNGLSIHWFPRSKHEDTLYTDKTKPNSTWADKIKPSSTWADKTKHE